METKHFRFALPALLWIKLRTPVNPLLIKHVVGFFKKRIDHRYREHRPNLRAKVQFDEYQYLILSRMQKEDITMEC